MRNPAEEGEGPVLVEHASREAQAVALAAQVAADLSDAIASDGRALLAVPGGTTPAAFLAHLGAAEIDWHKVTIVPTDERAVPADDVRSNERLIRGTLLAGSAAAARFLSLHGSGPALTAGAAGVARVLDALLPIDVAVLGMGADGHTASLFPGAPELAVALAPGAPAVLAVTAPGAAEPRVTLTGPVLAGARRVYLLIAGQEKRTALETALADGPVAEAPVRTVLCAPVTVHLAP